jgi:hypothetical protein
MALGFFIIHVLGNEYGIRAPDASMLANSYDAVKERLNEERRHAVFFSRHHSANDIATSFMDAVYGCNPEVRLYFGESHDIFTSILGSRKLVWAPDGDSAFDDGSYVLQFDVGDNVRVIAFKSKADGIEMLSDVFVDSMCFYKLLSEWVEKFEQEWNLFPKSPSCETTNRDTGYSTD